MCDKVPYETYKLAVAALKAVSSRERQQFKAYKCDECGQFHLTSIKKRFLPKRLNALEKLNYDKDIKQIKKKIDDGTMQQQKPTVSYYKRSTYKLGDMFPNMKKPKHK